MTEPVARLFVAVPIPRPISELLLRLQPPRGDGVRLITPTDFHITLHFLGQAAVRAVEDAIAQVEARPFAIHPGRTGSFLLRDRRRILMVVVDPSDGLTELHRKIGEALGTTGFRPESRPWIAHITVARLSATAPRSLVDRFTAAELPAGPLEFECREFALYASETAPEGARYHVLKRYRTGPADSGRHRRPA